MRFERRDLSLPAQPWSRLPASRGSLSLQGAVPRDCFGNGPEIWWLGKRHQGSANRLGDEGWSGRDYHVEDAHAHAGGAAFHRLRPRGGKANGDAPTPPASKTVNLIGTNVGFWPFASDTASQHHTCYWSNSGHGGAIMPHAGLIRVVLTARRPTSHISSPALSPGPPRAPTHLGLPAVALRAFTPTWAAASTNGPASLASPRRSASVTPMPL